MPSYLRTLNYANYRVGDVVTIEEIYYPEPDYHDKNNFIGDIYVVTRVDSVFKPSYSLARNIWLTLLFRTDKGVFKFGSNRDSRNFWLAYTKLKLMSRGE